MPKSVYDTVGVDSPDSPVTPLRSTATAKGGTAAMWRAQVNGGAAEPVVFFYGAEFAPYAAAQRWPLVLALSRFGTFRRIGLVQSSMTAAFPNVSTFTFYDTYYSSKYVILESVERYGSLNPTGAKYLSLQIPDQRQRAGDRQLRIERDHVPLARRGQPVGPERRQHHPERPDGPVAGPDRRGPELGRRAR